MYAKNPGVQKDSNRFKERVHQPINARERISLDAQCSWYSFQQIQQVLAAETSLSTAARRPTQRLWETDICVFRITGYHQDYCIFSLHFHDPLGSSGWSLFRRMSSGDIDQCFLCGLSFWACFQLCLLCSFVFCLRSIERLWLLSKICILFFLALNRQGRAHNCKNYCFDLSSHFGKNCKKDRRCSARKPILINLALWIRIVLTLAATLLASRGGLKDETSCWWPASRVGSHLLFAIDVRCAQAMSILWIWCLCSLNGTFCWSVICELFSFKLLNSPLDWSVASQVSVPCRGGPRPPPISTCSPLGTFKCGNLAAKYRFYRYLCIQFSISWYRVPQGWLEPNSPLV